MSNTAAISRKGTRRELDFYPTPSFATEEFFKIVPLCGTIYEPCVGQRDIADVIVEHCKIQRSLYAYGTVLDKLVTNDIDPNTAAHFHLDATKVEAWQNINPDYTITNPPFNLASEIIPLAFEYSKVGIAMLLRGSYTEPTFKRQQWLKHHEDYLSHIIYLPRISFTGDGKTDSVSANWYFWTKAKVQGCTLRWVLKTKNNASRKSRT